MSDGPYHVLFLCTGNSVRSIMAEAILNSVGAPRFKAYSAGSRPKGEVSPQTLALLRSFRCETDGLRSKSWEEFAAPGAPKLDFVFTVCGNAANEACPVWPGRPISARWGVPDPAAAVGSDASHALFDCYRLLQTRIRMFCALPLASLDPLSLKRMIEDIGKMHSRDAEGTA